MIQSHGMTYEEMPFKKKTTIKNVEHMSSFALVWVLVKRHKVGLLSLGNIILVLNWALPQWTEMVKALIS